jgi:hypothetical protein
LTTLRAAPYALDREDEITFTVRAYNSYGWSIMSQENSLTVALVQTEPDTLTGLTYVATSSSMTNIALSWTALVSTSWETGGAPIESYNPQMKLTTEDASAWADVQGEVGAETTVTTADITTGLTAGLNYDFRVRARNAHGWGLASTTLTVRASGVPAKPDAPTAELSSMDALIAWTPPSSNYATITAIRLSIENSNGQLVEETTYCDGSSAVIRSQSYCLVPMSHLIASYGLTKGTLIRPKVEAYNINGWGEVSEFPTSGDSTTIETEPIAMAAPTEAAGSD